MKYRPEIDGLRTIAILSVIFYHAKIIVFEIKILEGGFIGVDIFFVISGYLITSLIINELNYNGSFNFINFYKKRIKRIIPALIVVMIVSFPIAWIYLLPSALSEYSKSILYSLGFVSNFYFLISGQEYGAESALLKPFLHTWSLSIEEQFYILYPIFLVLVNKYLNKFFFEVLLLTIFVSFFLATNLSFSKPHISFYILPTRAWELMTGSIIAYLEIKKIKIIKNQYKNKIIYLATICIFYSIFFFNESTWHPSYMTLFPVIGTALLLVTKDKNNFIIKILSSNFFVKIGLISYSLYLWHFPIFSFARIIGISESNILFKLILILISIILSFVTFKYVEKPARR